jgi:leader peptidase (prepilin peptidase)/N-methyltransferase
MLTALLFFACWLLFPHTHAKAAVGMGFVSVLVAAMFIDLGHMIIPDEFTLGAGVAGVVLSCLVPALHGVHGAPWMLTSMQAGVLSLRGLLVGSGFVLWVAMLAETTLRKEAMGMGDVKFVGMIGAFCGWRGAIFSFFGGAAVNLIWIAAALAWERLAGRAAAAAPKSEDADGEPVQLGVGAQVPFGPGIAVAGGLYFLFFEPPVTAWFGHFAALL